jgi:hypothetical protein
VTLDAMTTTRAKVTSSKGPHQDAFGPPFKLLGCLEQAGLPPEHLQDGLISDRLVDLHA